MKQSDGGLAPSYNVQVSADAAHGFMVDLDISQHANDSAELLPAAERIQQRRGRAPQQVVADGGYTTLPRVRGFGPVSILWSTTTDNAVPIFLRSVAAVAERSPTRAGREIGP